MFFLGNCLFKKRGTVYLLEHLSTLKNPTVFFQGKLDDIHPFIGFWKDVKPSPRHRVLENRKTNQCYC